MAPNRVIWRQLDFKFVKLKFFNEIFTKYVKSELFCKMAIIRLFLTLFKTFEILTDFTIEKPENFRSLIKSEPLQTTNILHYFNIP